MAKRKKKSSAVVSNLHLIAALAALVAVVFILAPAIGYDGMTFSGIEAAFGVKIADAFFIKGEIPFGIAAFAGYVLLLGGAVIGIVLNKKLGAVLAGVACLIGAVLILLVGTYTKVKLSSGLGGSSLQSVDWSLQWGAVVTGILGIVAALVNLYNAFAVKKK